MLNEDKTKIRACQDHSIDVNLELKPIIPPKFLYHGTKIDNYDSIIDKGILKMNRQYVHLSKDIFVAYEVGKRHGEPLIFLIFAKQMYNDGYNFYLSENGVWLTNHVPSKYIQKDNSR